MKNSNLLLEDARSLEDVRSFFSQDRFATEACGCKILEARHGHAVCSLELTGIHRNAQQNVMGGAIFTLADFCLAVACNLGENPTVSVSNTIEFLSATRGSTLTATCNTSKSGRSLGFYTVEVRDDLNTLVARMTSTCFRRAE